MIFHLFEEVPNLDCSTCEITGSLKRCLTSPTYTNAHKDMSVKVGELTNQYIEENREILENEKKKSKEKTYEPS